MLVNSYPSEGAEEFAYQFFKYLWILKVWDCHCVCPDSSVINYVYSRKKDFVVVVPRVALLHLLCVETLIKSCSVE